MKKLLYLLSISFFLGNFCVMSAQEIADVFPADYKKRHPIHDYSEKELSNTDSIPDFGSKSQPFKLTGTVFMNDGVTPAKDVILYINQADENGDYDLRIQSKKRYVHHRGWVKTNADGQYTFFTFVPGRDRYSKAPKSIHLVILEPGNIEYSGDDFVFDDDGRLSKFCRKRLTKKGIDNILKLEKKGTAFIAVKNIILENDRVDLAKK